MTKRDRKIIKLAMALFIISTTIIILTITYVLTTKKNCTFEYIKNGKVGHSKVCYIKKGITYCIDNNKEIDVDNFYTTY